MGSWRNSASTSRSVTTVWGSNPSRSFYAYLTDLLMHVASSKFLSDDAINNSQVDIIPNRFELVIRNNVVR